MHSYIVHTLGGADSKLYVIIMLVKLSTGVELVKIAWHVLTWKAAKAVCWSRLRGALLCATNSAPSMLSGNLLLVKKRQTATDTYPTKTAERLYQEVSNKLVALVVVRQWHTDAVNSDNLFSDPNRDDSQVNSRAAAR